MSYRKDRSCDRKIRYINKAKVKEAITHKNRVLMKKSSYYKCQFCQGYHIYTLKRCF